MAKKLRRAVFYSQPPYLDLNEAHRYYRLALAAAAEARMDPFGDPVIAIKLAAVAMFKRAGQYPLASEALRNICVDCHRWLDEFGDAHRHDGRRTRILRNFVTLSIDLADLYACKYVNEPENAEQSLVGAVDVALAETRRREREGDAEGEGEWFQPAEIGMMLEGMHRPAPSRLCCFVSDAAEHSGASTRRKTSTTLRLRCSSPPSTCARRSPATGLC